MGYYTRDHGIRCFTPDNTPTCLYVNHGSAYSLRDLLDDVHNHFGPNVDFDALLISSEHIQTDCLGYDRYDSSDYTNYLVITLNDT